MSDLPSQYAEEVETFRQILDLPDPRKTLPRSSTTLLGLDNEKGQQELRPRGPSAMLPLNPILKDLFEKFEQDFLASNLPEGNYIKPPASTAKYYKVGQPCCVTSIYAAWHIGIASSSNFVASSVVVTLCIPDSISKMACQI